MRIHRERWDFVGGLLFRNGLRKREKKERKKKTNEERKKFPSSFTSFSLQRHQLARAAILSIPHTTSPPASPLSIIRFRSSYDRLLHRQNESIRITKSALNTTRFVPSATQTVFENTSVIRREAEKGKKKGNGKREEGRRKNKRVSKRDHFVRSILLLNCKTERCLILW